MGRATGPKFTMTKTKGTQRACRIYEPYFTEVPDEAGYNYHAPDGMGLERVTNILKLELGLYRYSRQYAAQRGSDVHAACQYWDEGDLDENTLDSEISRYLAVYQRAVEIEGIEVLQNEVRRYHPKYLYAGTCDKIAKVKGVMALIDLKTGQEESWHAWQTAAYAEMLKSETGLLARFCLYVNPGCYTLRPHTGKGDFLQFLTLLSAYQIKKNAGYLKNKESHT